MKLLLDTCVSGGAVAPLARAGHDVVWTGAWEADPGDAEILAYAHAQNRVLVTLDKDFRELAIVHGHPHSGIVRLVGLAARQQADACLEAVERYGDELQQGAIVTLEPTRWRIRPAP